MKYSDLSYLEYIRENGPARFPEHVTHLLFRLTVLE